MSKMNPMNTYKAILTLVLDLEDDFSRAISGDEDAVEKAEKGLRFLSALSEAATEQLWWEHANRDSPRMVSKKK
jgi:hypothetical protein